MKRLTDIVFSLTVLILLAPMLLLAALAVVLDSGLPVFFKQTRVGLKGREFGMFKFRSMVINAASTGPYFTDANDARITRVGQFIRRTSIDELPQIINVLLGDMSLVGPRPDVPVQQSLYAPEDWAQRCSVRPGITGLAQVMIRSVGSHQDRLDLDLRYIRDQNLWVDVKVMWLTLGRLSGKGGN
jgi:lipopolysaccharide/colanic/teichoic acid biosynthesis glycosyltransferase